MSLAFILSFFLSSIVLSRGGSTATSVPLVAHLRYDYLEPNMVERNKNFRLQRRADFVKIILTWSLLRSPLKREDKPQQT